MTPDARIVSCPHGAECGACALLDVAYEAQVAKKRDVLSAALKRCVRLMAVAPLPGLPSPEVQGYRNRAKMAVEMAGERRAHLGSGRHPERRDDTARIGYFRFGSRTLVDAPDCRVLVPEILETTRALREVLSQRALADLPLRFIDVRCGTDPKRQHVTLVLSDEEARLTLSPFKQACRHVTGISVNINPGTGSRVIKGPVKHLWGERHVFVDADGVRLHVSAGAFFQVNLGLLPAIHARLKAHLWGSRALADLFAGVGTHGLALAAKFERVLMIEGVTAAVRDARTAMDVAGITNVNIVGAPVERSLARFHAEGADAVILNPSREGVRPEVLAAIAVSQARKIAYLSCEPSTLARDLDVLVQAGLKVSSVLPIDMMPQTDQVEALALLEREGAAPPSPRGRRAGPARGTPRPPARRQHPASDRPRGT